MELVRDFVIIIYQVADFTGNQLFKEEAPQSQRLCGSRWSHDRI